MATAAELARPGVEVLQSLRRASPTFLRPTLSPVVVGPAFEVINVLTSDGTVNAKAKYGSYAQLGKTITHSAFPDPRSNIDEVEVQPDSIRPFLFTGGRLSELLMEPGESFLTASHVAYRAVLRVTQTSMSLGGKSLVLAIDQPVSADSSQDVTISFPGSSPYTPAQAVSVINDAYGMEVATVTTDTNGDVTGFQIASPSYGALSSVTIRSGGTANSVLGLGWDTDATPAVGKEERVEGAGYRAYNLQNNTTQSPWIEYYRGGYFFGGAEDTTWPDYAVMVNVADGTELNAKHAAVTFGASGVPIQVGDQLMVDGVRLKNGEVSRVETNRIRLGVVNGTLSTADERGRYTSKVYDDALLGLLVDSSPFAPKYVWFKATGLSSNTGATAASVTGSAAATAAVAASVESDSAPDFTGGIALGYLRLDYVVTVDGVATPGSFVFTSQTPYTSMANVAAAISIPGVAATNDTGKLKLATVKTGRLQAITVKASSSAAGPLGFSTSTDTSSTDQSDAKLTGLSGTDLKFSFDHGTHIYDVSFTDDSLDLAVDAINTLVGAAVARKDNAGTHLVLTSSLSGLASLVTIVDGTGLTHLGFTEGQVSSAGTGRPNPDAYLDDSNNLVVGAQLVRDPVTGYPLDFSTSPATLYIQFKGLRKDVSPSAKVAGVVRLTDEDTLSSVMDPVTEENPLSLGAYFMMLNAPNFEVKCLGVDETSGAAPEGTELAYARAASFLEAEEVYAIALLTHNEVVHGLFSTHALVMSEPEQGGERIVLFNKKVPVRRSPVSVASGTQANSTSTANQLLLDTTPQQGLIDAGLNPALPLSVANGVYIEFNWDGVFYRYNVKSVTGGLVNFNTSFASGENDDLFYTTFDLPSGVVNASWTMKVRGTSVTIPGSNPARLDYSLIASTVSEMNGGIGNRRAYSLFPDTVKTTLAGLEKEVPGYYACACVAGQIAGLPPQQGLTNYPIVGLTGVSGVEKYTRKQLNQMAGGGTYILMQEVQGGPVFARHQLSTDVTSVETRELSITKVVDFTAKFLRVGIRRYIGRQNINSVFLDTVGTTIQAMLQFLTEQGILNGANLNNIIQDPKNPDTVMVDITLDVPFPCNYLRLTLVV